MQLTSAQRKVILAALEIYRIKKSAEGKLEEHKTLKQSREAAAEVAKRYATLVDLVVETKKVIEG